jgi:hypothetical protein
MNRIEKWKITAGMVIIVAVMIYAHTIRRTLSLLVSSMKLPRERKKIFAERAAKGSLFLPKGLLIKFNVPTVKEYSRVYTDMDININDVIFNIILY